MTAEPIPLIIVALCGSIYLGRVLLRRRRTYREVIDPEIRKLGLSVCGIRRAPAFAVGPFPKAEFVLGGWQTKTPFGRGEFTVYRVVDAKDCDGGSHTLWCKLEFEAFKMRSIQVLPSEMEGSRTRRYRQPR
jgi:hypothetical protein